MKAISEEQFGDLLLGTFEDYDSLEPCYTKKQIEDVLDRLLQLDIAPHHKYVAVYLFKQELEKLEGE